MTDLPWATATLYDRGASLQATFVPDAGMICSSLRHRGDELLAQNSGLAAYAERGATMGIPLLYPWANRLAGFGYDVGGRTVEVPHDQALVALDDNGLPIHGVIGGRLAFELTRSPGPDAASLTARLSWSASQPEPFAVFPFRHDLDYEARLSGGCLELWMTVHACGADPVPLAFGFHPYLSAGKTPRESWLVELPAMRPMALDASQIPVAPGKPVGAQRFELAGREFDDGFDSVSEPARFAVEGAGRRIEVELLEGYPCAQVFAPRHGQFICFEPMTAPANALRSGMGLRLLAPGERYRAGFSVRIADSRS
jgi:aldose 1-epimerase